MSALAIDTAETFYMSLHTADPGETGSQAVSEATFAGYARAPVARSAIINSGGSNELTVEFPACTGRTETVTHFGIGSDASGVGHLFFRDALPVPLTVHAGITAWFRGMIALEGGTLA